MPAQLKETTMSPLTRTLIRVRIEEGEETGDLVERLMGKRPEMRFQYIQQHAKFVDAEDLDVRRQRPSSRTGGKRRESRCLERDAARC
jgi:hypothetical protein